MLTPQRVIHPSSANDAEILVACVDEKGKPANVTIVDAVLGAQLAATPALLPNPAYQPLIDQVLAKAVDQITTEATAIADAAGAAQTPAGGTE